MKNQPTGPVLHNRLNDFDDFCDFWQRAAPTSPMPLDTTQTRLDRLRRWLDRVRPLTDPNHPLGAIARRELPSETALSEELVAWGLDQAFEINATDEELRELVDRVVPSPVAHVSLSANVFVGALRAIAVALASSSNVRVRCSRREPLTATLLHRAAPDAFALVPTLSPAPGDHVWAYGADHTLAQLRAEFPRGVVLHAHGDGFGVLVVDAGARLTDEDFDAMAVDVAAFDQRGCLSPRFVLLEGRPSKGHAFALQLLETMNRVAERLPFGPIDPAAQAEAARHRETWRYLGEAHTGKGGMVSLDFDGQPWGKPPSLRTIHVRLTENALADLVGQSDAVTAVGSRRNPALIAKIEASCPKVRWSPFGSMQRPRLDGPVDRRPDPLGCVL